MYSDLTMINVDLTNLEFGAINGFTDLNPFFWLCLHDFWIYLLIEMGRPSLSPGLSELIQPTDFLGEPTDYCDIPINEPPFVCVPTGLQFSILTMYSQLNELGLPNANN